MTTLLRWGHFLAQNLSLHKILRPRAQAHSSVFNFRSGDYQGSFVIPLPFYIHSLHKKAVFLSSRERNCLYPFSSTWAKATTRKANYRARAVSVHFFLLLLPGEKHESVLLLHRQQQLRQQLQQQGQDDWLPLLSHRVSFQRGAILSAFQNCIPWSGDLTFLLLQCSHFLSFFLSSFLPCLSFKGLTPFSTLAYTDAVHVQLFNFASDIVDHILRVCK